MMKLNKMVKDAEANKEADKKKRETVDAKKSSRYNYSYNRKKP